MINERVAARCYPWSRRYETDHYLGLLSTHSDHRLLPPKHLVQLLGAIGEILEASSGGIEVAYEATLHIAIRAD